MLLAATGGLAAVGLATYYDEVSYVYEVAQRSGRVVSALAINVNE